ncbi:arginine--tRNA ligase [Paenibacillus sp. IITD108]|uniref:arginine--tRNA ligase n=1 Tax=Paenibacillus sp. IITD108 TaxID=3116649 RepID=UPI002F3EE84F
MISIIIVNHLKQAVQALFDEQGLPVNEISKLNLYIEQPAYIEHGDYSSNIAMQLARTLRQSPLSIAEQLKLKLQQISEPLFQSLTVAKPGFINVRINWEEWSSRSFSLPTHAGRKVIIEHTSINPNKSAHIGHLRNACIGDTLVRMLRRGGLEVEVHNYIDDLGNQLADTVVGLLQTEHQKKQGRFGDYCWDVYAEMNKSYEQNPTLLEQRAKVLHELEEGGGPVAWIGLLAAERIVRDHIEEMQQFNIAYDLLVWESNIVREGFWEAAFKKLKDTEHFVQITDGKLAGCWVLKTDDAAESEDGSLPAEHVADKVLIRSNGILTYTAKDIAYHLWKFGLLEKDFQYKSFSEGLWTTNQTGGEAFLGKAETVINVIDYRQQYPQQMVKQALAVLGYNTEAERLHHVSYGVVSLSPDAASELGIDTSDGKSSYAMSGRQGIGIKIADLLSYMEKVIDQKRSVHSGLASRAIAAAAIRYQLLKYNLLTEVVFDMKQAAEVTGNSGVYLMYAHARASQILLKSGEPFFSKPSGNWNLDTAEHALLRQIAHWQDTLYTACRDYSPNQICNYAYELASAFNNFYTICPILKAKGEQRALRLWLTALFRETMADVLRTLGMPTPDQM